jgi:hypothetical protein
MNFYSRYQLIYLKLGQGLIRNSQNTKMDGCRADGIPEVDAGTPPKTG